jgi:hypothetical protein
MQWHPSQLGSRNLKPWETKFPSIHKQDTEELSFLFQAPKKQFTFGYNMTWKSRTSKRIPISTSTTALNLGKTPLHESTHRLQTPQREPTSSKHKNHPST